MNEKKGKEIRNAFIYKNNYFLLNKHDILLLLKKNNELIALPTHTYILCLYLCKLLHL